MRDTNPLCIADDELGPKINIHRSKTRSNPLIQSVARAHTQLPQIFQNGSEKLAFVRGDTTIQWESTNIPINMFLSHLHQQLHRDHRAAISDVVYTHC